MDNHTFNQIKPYGPVSVGLNSLGVVCVGAVIATALSALDMNIVNGALLQMAMEFRNSEHIGWTITAYMIAMTTATPLYGKLSDIYGCRRAFAASFALFLTASIICSLAMSEAQIILARALQGLGGSGLLILSQIVIADLAPPRERGKYQGILVCVFMVSSAAGPTVGAFLTTHLSWQWIFYANLPLGTLSLALILSGLRFSARRLGQRVDIAGASLFSAASTILLLLLANIGSIVAWTSPITVAIAGIVAVIGMLFLLQQSYAAYPMFDLRLFRLRAFSVAVTVTGVTTFSMLGALVFLPRYFEIALVQDPHQVEIMLMQQAAAMAIGAIASGYLSSRFGLFKPFVLLGILLEAAALISLSIIVAIQANGAAFSSALICLGLGMGMVAPCMTVVVQNSVGDGNIGMGTATISYIRSLAGSVGATLAGGMMVAWLTQDFATIGLTMNASAMIVANVEQIKELPPQIQAVVLDAYRVALAVGLSVGGFLTMAASMLLLMLPDDRQAISRDTAASKS
ncbi:MFS transporter [Rhizobium sp. NPDC090279]|uniref:MFS transporter n=1 Tax=Rhizobium sp. NPDC090279 TaxID=3364499 RepID=UPI00383B228A